jgi:hypothetical protein
VDATVWKAVYAERCPYRLGRGRWKRASVRYYLKGFQTGQHTLQYLASCLLYFQNKQGKSCVENCACDVDKEDKIGGVVIITSLL